LSTTPNENKSISQSKPSVQLNSNSNNKNINENKNESNLKQPTMKNIIHPFVKRHVIKNIKKELIGQTIKVGGWQKTLRQSGEAF